MTKEGVNEMRYAVALNEEEMKLVNQTLRMLGLPLLATKFVMHPDTPDRIRAMGLIIDQYADEGLYDYMKDGIGGLVCQSDGGLSAELHDSRSGKGPVVSLAEELTHWTEDDEHIRE